MAPASRRGFIAAVGAGAATVVVAQSASADDSTFEVTEMTGGLGPAIVAYVEDRSSGRLVIWVGENEVEITDQALVARLVKAAGR